MTSLPAIFVCEDVMAWGAHLDVEVTGPMVQEIVQELRLLKVGDHLSLYSIPKPSLGENCVHSVIVPNGRHQAHGLFAQGNLQMSMGLFKVPQILSCCNTPPSLGVIPIKSQQDQVLL